jgi:hypothetical protein
MTAKKTTAEHLPVTMKEVWQVLSAVDCSEHAKEKNGLTFLSWAWAWGIMMQYYPDVHHAVLGDVDHADGTKTVRCTVSIPTGNTDADGNMRYLARDMWLPVMDYKNKAIPNPDARAISDSRMRCMTKCLAMFGLGHYIYAGEDVPSESKQTAEAAVAKPAPTEPVKVNPPKQSPDGVNIPDAETASSTVAFMCETVGDFHSDSMESLVDFWNKNKSLIDYLDTNFPEQYATLKAYFTQTKTTLTSK